MAQYEHYDRVWPLWGHQLAAHQCEWSSCDWWPAGVCAFCGKRAPVCVSWKNCIVYAAYANIRICGKKRLYGYEVYIWIRIHYADWGNKCAFPHRNHLYRKTYMRIFALIYFKHAYPHETAKSATAWRTQVCLSVCVCLFLCVVTFADYLIFSNSLRLLNCTL